jgi:predicted Zn-ribbon and HTH transcriptional regulator
MGWGDEAEAWLRSKLGQGDYEGKLKQIRDEYAQFEKEYPRTQALTEFAGGAAPGVAMMFVPGGQAAGAQQVTRSTLGTLARLGLMGAATGAVSGAGSATEGDRTSGAISGGLIGGTAGVALPALMGAGKGAAGWLRDRIFQSDKLAQERAISLLNKAVERSGMTPAQVEARMLADKAAGVPSVLANVSPATSRLTRGAAKVGGEGAEKIENVLTSQKLGARERVHQQVVKGLNPKNYYDELSDLQTSLKTKAAPHYEAAYAHGEVTDPEVLKFMELPQFQQGVGEAKKLLAAEGRKLPTVKVTDPATGEVTEKLAPTVEVLDQVKRGLDALIERETDAVTGKTTSLGRIYTQKKNEFLNALDAAVPDYAKARSVYRGDAELMDAMRSGLNKFGSMDHEQVVKAVAGMSQGEKEAFRTGVARKLYGTIMVPSNEPNAAQRVFGSPEMQAKLQPLFDSPGQFDLFKNAMQRESQLYQHASRILGGSDTAENIALKEAIQGSSTADAIDRVIAGGGFKGALGNLALSAFSKGQMTDKTASKLANMLMSKDPHEVAAVVKMLEEHAAEQVPKALRAGAATQGAVTGTSIAVQPSPTGTTETPDIESYLSTEKAVQGPDIEAYLAEQAAKTQRAPAQLEQ